VLFVVQRPDARLFAPNEAADPRFAAALRRAAAEGVRVAAYTCRVSTRSATLGEPIPVELA
jgi:sugar fermentation stimulation protein A